MRNHGKYGDSEEPIGAAPEYGARGGSHQEQRQYSLMRRWRT
jgi:hypothetical protein